MSIFDTFRSSEEREETGYEPVVVDAELADALRSPAPRDAIAVRPHKDNGGIEAMDEVLESLHTVETESPRFRRGARNVSPAHAFEMRYAAERPGGDRVASLQYLAGDDTLDGTLERQLQQQYPDSQIERQEPTFLPAQEGQYVAGATLALRRYTLYPIKNIDLEGFFTDPTGSILQEMVGVQDEAQTDANVAVQVVFRPEDRTWTDGVANGGGVADVDADDPNVDGAPSLKDLAYNLREPTLKWHRKRITFEQIEHPPSKVDKQVAKLLEEQQGEKGWHLCLRVFAVSDDPDVAVQRASKTAGMFRNFYENNAEQTFIPQPLAGDELREEIVAAADRAFEETGIVKAQREVAGLVNVPKAEFVATNKMRWSMARPGEGIPPGTPRFDYERHGVGGADEDRKQLAMLEANGLDEPYWYGFGTKHGVEAGVRPETLRTHQFVGGGTGKGKTTFLVNLASQVIRRGHGALIFDPKGRDVDRFIREWPDDRDEEDFIFVDLSDDFDQQVRFNFLEVPGDADPDTRAFATAVEALTDDLVAMMAQAGGGDDNYWGPLMNRVARTLIRGMAKSDRTCTLLDLAFVVTAPGNRDQFYEWMAEERIHFIKEAAKRIREQEEEDLEPLAGRLDQWVQNDAIRNLISARESTVSIQQAVEDGKVIVVRNAPSSGETEKRLFATALIRRAWVAARESEPESRPPFHVIVDEFDSIVTYESNIHSILSEARAFDFPLTLSCQNPSNQLPDRVAEAIANQCETFITYNPGGKRDARMIQAQHSPDVEWEDLVNLSKYRFYMRTHDDNDELTHSFKVDAFPPVADVRRRAEGGLFDPAGGGMTDQQLREFKRRSIDRYGTSRPTPEQQKRESHFATDVDEAGADATDAGDDLELTDRREALICKAVYDEAIQTDAGDGFVAGTTVADRMREYLPDAVDVEHQSRLWGLVDQVPEDLIEREVREDDVYLRCTERGKTPIFETGVSASGGGAKHRELLKDVYDPLTRAGARVRLPEQDGHHLPDGVATLADVDVFADAEDELATLPLRKRRDREAAVLDEFREANPMLARLSDAGEMAVEAESSTGESKPAQTVRNLAQAVNEGQRCLFAVRESVAPTVWNTLTSPPYRTTFDETGETRFYNSRDLRIDGETMLRPATCRETIWTRHATTGAYVLRDAAGKAIARFPDAESVFQDASRYPATTAEAEPGDEWASV
ncbi:MAG: type IV secretory system conjugative DNA transfer family protein, partial [Haloferacaceae archaeon]